MAFLPVRRHLGKTRKAQVAGSQTIVKGDALIDSSGYLATAAAGGGVPVVAVALEAASSTTQGDEILVMDTSDEVEFLADCDANPAQAEMNKAVDLASKSTLDTDAVLDQIFFAKEIVGAAADRKVRGYFTYGAPNA